MNLTLSPYATLSGVVRIVELMYAMLIGLYIGMGLVIFLFVNPRMATKLVSRILPALIVEEIARLFSDEEFVRQTFAISHEHLKRVMIDAIKKELSDQGQAIVDAQSARVSEMLQEHQVHIPPEFFSEMGKKMTAVLNGWYGQKVQAAKKEQERVDMETETAIQYAQMNKGNPQALDLIKQRIFQSNPMYAMAFQLLSSMGDNGNSPPPRGGGDY